MTPTGLWVRFSSNLFANYCCKILAGLSCMFSARLVAATMISSIASSWPIELLEKAIAICERIPDSPDSVATTVSDPLLLLF